MKARIRRAVGLVLLLSAPLLVAAAPGHARTLSVEDVIRLHFAGVSEDVIISELIVTDSEFEFSVDEIVRLKEAGLSDRLLKFMIDTGLPAEDESGLAIAEEYDYGEEYEYGEEEGYGQIWENVIVEEEATTTEYFSTLNWSYPSWYYDAYWYDYWYYDCGYAPYRSSWCISFGAWYPGWYSYRSVWAPACYGYRGYYGYYPANAYNHGWNDGYAWGYQDGWNDASWPGVNLPPAGLSDVKYKQAGGGTGKILYADAGLKVGDVHSLTKRAGSAGLDRPTVRTKKVLVADTRNGRLDQRVPSDVRSRPIRVGSSDTPKSRSSSGYLRTATRTNGKSVGDRKTTGTRTRKAATYNRPVVTRRPSGTGKANVSRPKGGKPRQPSAVSPKPASRKRSSPKAKVSPASKKKPTPTRQVKQSTPQRAAPRAQTAPRSAPRAKPSRSAPSTPRSARGSSKGRGR